MTQIVKVIKELNGEKEWKKAYPVMKQLRTHLDEEVFLKSVKDAANKEGYKLVALYEDDSIVAVVGFMPMFTLYNGRSVWVCDLVTDSHIRSKGHGSKLLKYVHDWAEKNGYENIALSSGLKRLDAHRFYESKMGYDKVSYVFLKRL